MFKLSMPRRIAVVPATIPIVVVAIALVIVVLVPSITKSVGIFGCVRVWVPVRITPGWLYDGYGSNTLFATTL